MTNLQSTDYQQTALAGTALCCAGQPGSDRHRCIMYAGHEGPHRSFVGLWNEGDATARRRPAGAFVRPQAQPPRRFKQFSAAR